MEAVAQASGMSVQGVYFAFQNKANLLQAAVEAAEPVRPERTDEPDPDLLLRRLVDDAVAGLVATGALALAVAAAPPADRAAVEVHRHLQKKRSTQATSLVQQVRALRPLAPGVTAKRASDVVFALLSPQLHAVLVRDRGGRRGGTPRGQPVPSVERSGVSRSRIPWRGCRRAARRGRRVRVAGGLEAGVDLPVGEVDPQRGGGEHAAVRGASSRGTGTARGDDEQQRRRRRRRAPAGGRRRRSPKYQPRPARRRAAAAHAARASAAAQPRATHHSVAGRR